MTSIQVTDSSLYPLITAAGRDKTSICLNPPKAKVMDGSKIDPSFIVFGIEEDDDWNGKPLQRSQSIHRHDDSFLKRIAGCL